MQKQFLSFIKFLIIMLYVSFLYTWYNSFLVNQYYASAGIFPTFIIGLFPVWGGWLTYQIIKQLNKI
jgi:hypothetical protein